MRTTYSALLLSVFWLSFPLTSQAVDEATTRALNPTGAASVLFFVATDCPIANSYAPEIQHICREYASKGVTCTMVYADAEVDAVTIRKHREDFGYNEIPAVADSQHRLADATGATITPEAVIAGPHGKVLYRGKIDNLYARLGRQRQVVTKHYLRDALDEIIAGKIVSRPETKAVGCYIPR